MFNAMSLPKAALAAAFLFAANIIHVHAVSKANTRNGGFLDTLDGAWNSVTDSVSGALNILDDSPAVNEGACWEAQNKYMYTSYRIQCLGLYSAANDNTEQWRSLMNETCGGDISFSSDCDAAGVEVADDVKCSLGWGSFNLDLNKEECSVAGAGIFIGVVLIVLATLYGTVSCCCRWTPEDAAVTADQISDKAKTHLDNVKFGLIFLAIMHYFGTLYPVTHGKDGTDVIYSGGWLQPTNNWHMGTFAFVVGMLSRGPATPTQFKDMVFTLLLPWFFYCCIIAPAMGYLTQLFLVEVPSDRLPMEQQDWLLSIMNRFTGQDNGVQWFLWCCVLWKLFGFFLAPFTPFVRVILALTISAVGEYAHIHVFFANRALARLPVFIFGTLYPLDMIENYPCGSLITRVVAGSVLAVFILLQIQFFQDLGIPFGNFLRVPSALSWPTYGLSNASNPPSPDDEWWVLGFYWARGLARNIAIMVQGLAFIYLMPRGKSYLTTMGQNSLNFAYLLSPYFLIILTSYVQPITLAENGSELQELLNILTSASICFSVVFVLTAYPIRYIFAPFLQPTWVNTAFGASKEQEDSVQSSLLDRIFRTGASAKDLEDPEEDENEQLA